MKSRMKCNGLFQFGVAGLGMLWVIGSAAADVKINELYPNMTGSDDMEFIELYNTDLVNSVSLNGLAIIEINGGTSFANNIGDIEDIAILDGFTIAPGGYFVYGDPGTPNVDLEGFDQSFGLTNETCTYLLVEYTQEVLEDDPATDNGGLDIDAEPDCIEDFELGEILDGISMIDANTGGTDCTYYGDFGVPVFGPDITGLFYPAGVARNNSGEDTDTVDDLCELSFARDGSDGGVVPTPGASNGDNVCSAPFAVGGLTLTTESTPEDIKLEGNVPGTPFVKFRIIALAGNATLSDAGTDQIITEALLPFTLSRTDDGTPFALPQVTYSPDAGYTGLDTFLFDAVDINETQDSPDVPQELAVQGDQCAMTELMEFSNGAGDSYEFTELHNYSDSDVGLTRIDSSDTGIIDTTDNLIIDGVPAVVPAHTTRILAPDGASDDFLCEWDLNAEDVIFIPADKWEFFTDTTRIFLFGENDTLVDAIDLETNVSGGFPTGPDDGSSLDLRDDKTAFDTLLNDSPVPWSYTPDPPPAARRTSNTLGDTGSPGYVPLLDPEFTPAAPCVGECCLQDGVSCAIVTASECADELNGVFIYDDGDCATNPPTCAVVTTGACCANWGECLADVTEFDCLLIDGNYLGDGEDCPADCGFAPAADVVVNEVWADDPSTDDAEFIELFGPPNTSLAGLSIIAMDGDTGGDTSSTNYNRVNFQVDFTSGTRLNDEGYLVLGAGTTPNVDVSIILSAIQNGTQTYGLVVTGDIAFCVDTEVCAEIDDDELTQASIDELTADAIDTVATFDGTVGDHIYLGAPIVTDGAFAADHMYRCPNGSDTDSPLDWLVSFGNELGSPEDVSTAGGENACGDEPTFCPTPALCDGDANGDGVVDPLDVGSVLSRFGQDGTTEEFCTFDVNCDGFIDPLDSGYVQARFSTCDPVVPCELP